MVVVPLEKPVAKMGAVVHVPSHFAGFLENTALGVQRSCGFCWVARLSLSVKVWSDVTVGDLVVEVVCIALVVVLLVAVVLEC